MINVPPKFMVIPKFKKWDGHNPTMRAEPWQIHCDLVEQRGQDTIACLWYITPDRQHIKMTRIFSPLEIKKKGFVDRFMRVDAYQNMYDLPKHWRHPALTQP
jgi:hypothetical protein